MNKYYIRGVVVTDSYRIHEAKCTAEEFFQIKKSKESCLFLTTLEEKLIIVVDNYMEYESAILSISQEHAFFAKDNRDLTLDQRLSFDQRIFNFTTAASMHLETLQKQIKGKIEEIKYAHFNKFRQDLHASNLGYKLMQHIRNYVTHSNLSLSGITISFSVDKELKAPHQSVRALATASIKDWFHDKAINKELYNELMIYNNNKDELDTRELIQDYMRCIIDVHKKAIEVLMDFELNCTSTYSRFIDKYSTSGDNTIEYVEAIEADENDRIINKIPIIKEVLDRNIWLRNRNKFHPAFPYAYVTSKPKQ